MSKLTAFWRGWVSLSQYFRGRGRAYGIFFGFYKTRHILLSDSANCTMLRAVGLTQYRCVTDGETDGQTDGRNWYSQYSACNASIAARCKNGLQILDCELHQNTFGDRALPGPAVEAIVLPQTT